MLLFRQLEAKSIGKPIRIALYSLIEHRCRNLISCGQIPIQHYLHATNCIDHGTNADLISINGNLVFTRVYLIALFCFHVILHSVS